MAREFTATSSQYLQVNSAAVTAAPFSISFWYHSYDTSITQYLMGISDRSVTNNYWYFYRHSFFADIRFFVSSSAGNAEAVTTADLSQDTWHHILGVEAAIDDRRVYLDGGNKGTNSTSRTPTGIDTMAIGTRIISSQPTGANHVDGRVAEVTIWDTALDNADALSLYARFSPFFVKPQNIVAHWSLIRDEDQDRVGGHDMTPYNTPTIAPHCPMIYPAPPSIPTAPTAVVAAWARHQSMTGVATKMG